MNEKKWKNIWRILQKTLIFAPLLERSTKSLDYGVMAAQQVLVLFVLVRIQVVQQKNRLSLYEQPIFFVYSFMILKSLYAMPFSFSTSKCAC